MPGYLTLITEDLLSEIAAQRILQYSDPESIFNNCLGKRGIGYIQQKLKNFNDAAKGMRIVVIVDRDKLENCPVQLISKWVSGARHPNLVIRFAEMEVEAWILADQERIAGFLEVPLNRIPSMPDNLMDPKKELISIARNSRSKRIRDEICPAANSKSVVGPAYNNRLEVFLRDLWRPDVAILGSPSLRRAEKRIKALALKQGFDS